jgi:hypothetical protein
MRIQPMITFLAALALLAQAAPAEAQIRERIKRATAAKAASAVAERALGGSAETPGAPGSPRFDEAVIEITPDLLERFTAGLAAESAEREEIPRLRRALPEPEEHDRCLDGLERDPTYQSLMRRADDSAADDDAFREYIVEKCGDDETSLQERPARMGRKAAGLTTRQYAVLKERVVPFCSNPGRTGGFVYSRTEAEALRPRCDALLPVLRANT